MIYQYRYKFYLNANHFVVINNKKGDPHSHCFELTIIVASMVDNEKTISFNNIESKVEEILAPYQNKLLNEEFPFTTIIPTLENICSYFKTVIYDTLIRMGWVLLSIEVSETPSRAFILSIDDIDFMTDILKENKAAFEKNDWESANKNIDTNDDYDDYDDYEWDLDKNEEDEWDDI